ncbi:MAG: translation initiation factor IF-3 [Planctomycetota bacterium]|jgi:translation initiation factor IF-3|nr:translation initiation factor IF-3 [Planctomycetota bacterium]
MTASGDKKELRLNEQIRGDEVRLIGEEGEAIGVVPLKGALEKAQTAELDLVEISPTAKPPVCRIMDYGKYKYQQAKRDHEQKRKHQASELKQLRIKSFRIEPHDVGIKREKARQFIEAGHRVLFVLMFRAREHSHADLGERLLLEQFSKPLADVAKMESPPRKDGKKMAMSLAPLANLKQILAAREKEEGRRRAEAERRLAEEMAARDLEHITRIIPKELVDDADDGSGGYDEAGDAGDDSPE